MSYTQTIMGGGFSAQGATAIAGGAATGLTAAGTTQATALSLGSLDVNMIATCASGAGVKVKSGAPGDSTTIFNGGSNACTVYPPVGAKFNALATDSGFLLAINTVCIVKCVSATQWLVNLSA